MMDKYKVTIRKFRLVVVDAKDDIDAERKAKKCCAFDEQVSFGSARILIEEKKEG